MESRIRAAPRFFVLHDRLEPQEESQKRPAKVVVALCHHLVCIVVPKYRRALTTLSFREDQDRANFLLAVFWRLRCVGSMHATRRL
jgi:hypothetical protein